MGLWNNDQSNYLKEDHRSYMCNLCSCELIRKPQKGLVKGSNPVCLYLCMYGHTFIPCRLFRLLKAQTKDFVLTNVFVKLTLSCRNINNQAWQNMEGGVRVCGIAVLGNFWCGVTVIFISKYGIAVFRVQAVCGKFKFYAAVVGEKIVVSRWSASFSWQEDTNPKRSPWLACVTCVHSRGLYCANSADKSYGF